jgi:4-oxalocrotonate tautomerase
VPLVRIDMLEGRSAQEKAKIADCTHRAMVETLGVPERDRFQIVTEHARDAFYFDRSYLDIERTDAFVLVGLTGASRTGTRRRGRSRARRPRAASP